MKKANDSGIYGMERFVHRLKQDQSAVEAAVAETWSNGVLSKDRSVGSRPSKIRCMAEQDLNCFAHACLPLPAVVNLPQSEEEPFQGIPTHSHCTPAPLTRKELAGRITNITLSHGKNTGKVLETEWALQGAFAGGIAMKKSVIAVLASVLLLSAAMPAFAKKHHRHHHHNHAQETAQRAQ
jgi:hypothetical protein